MFKFLSTALLVRYSPFSIAVWKWNASIKSRDKENLTSNFDHFVNLLTFTKFPWKRSKDRFPPRTHCLDYIYNCSRIFWNLGILSDLWTTKVSLFCSSTTDGENKFWKTRLSTWERYNITLLREICFIWSRNDVE